MKKDFEDMKNLLKEMEKELKGILDDEENEEEAGCLTGNCMICATDEGIKMSGDQAQLCTLLSKIIETLNKKAGIDKEILQKALDFAFMDIKDIKKDLLNKIKEMLEEDDD